MKLGRYSLPMADSVYYNTLTHKLIDLRNSPHPLVDLEANNMLPGQEYDAIIAQLFKRRETGILLIPSWECNLRCKHCYVGHLLKKPSGDRNGNTDPAAFAQFLHRMHEHFTLSSCYCIGGEPFLHPEAFRQGFFAGPQLSWNTTTNGIWNFDDNKDILTRLASVAFSIDGLPEEHNRTRKSLDKDINPFITTYRNIHRVIKELPHVDVFVQGSLVEERYNDAQMERWATLMLAVGVKPERLTLSVPATTKKWHGSEFNEHTSRITRPMPCCDWTTSRMFIVHENKVYSSYYKIDEVDPLGDINTAPAVLQSRYEDTILKHMPMLHDETCMTKCEAVGICWGLCTNARHAFTDGKPSSVCDRDFKNDLVRKHARETWQAQQPTAQPLPIG